MGTLHVLVFEKASDLAEFASGDANITDASTQQIVHNDGQWYLFYWTV